ncbi:PUA domain-containing protein [Methanopyrus sp.]
MKGPYPVERNHYVVIADKFAAESVYMGADLYAPGVVQADPDIRRGDRVTVISERGHPVASGEAVLQGREMEKRDRGTAVRVDRSTFSAPKIRKTEAYRRGWVYSQGLPSILAVEALSPEPGETVVDLCAAPGGKCSHVAQITGPGSKIIAIDRSAPRLERMKAQLRRLGIDWVETVHGDARKIVRRLRGTADVVLVDPPCTALGVRPKLWVEATYEEALGLPSYQYSLLRAGYEVLKEGGRLLYSTCTLTTTENELVVERAIRELNLEPETPVLRPARRSGHGAVFLPHRADVPGFFYAVLIKEGGSRRRVRRCHEATGNTGDGGGCSRCPHHDLVVRSS